MLHEKVLSIINHRNGLLKKYAELFVKKVRVMVGEVCVGGGGGGGGRHWICFSPELV